MDNQFGGDLAADPKPIRQNIQEKDGFDEERKGMTEVAAQDEKPHSAGSSSETGSEPDLRKYDSKIVKIRDVPEGDAALAHLPEHEREVLKRQIDIPEVSVSWLKLYRYATFWDKVIIWIATFCAIGGGAVMPLMTVSLL